MFKRVLNALLITGFSEAANGGVRQKENLKNLAIFTGKHLCQNLFFNKVLG